MNYTKDFLLVPILYGIISGLAWSLAIDLDPLLSLYVGAVTGFATGSLFFFIGTLTKPAVNENRKRTLTVPGNLLFYVFLFSMGGAFTSWISRILFSHF